MRTLGVGEHLVVESLRVVRAQHADVGVGPREVDQRLVAGRLADLLGRATRPDRLADVPERLAAVPVEHLQHRGDDPARISPKLAHVEQLDRRRTVLELGPQELQMRRRHGDRHRLVALEPGVDEVKDAGDVLVRVAVEERLMRLSVHQAVFAGGHGVRLLPLALAIWPGSAPRISLASRAGS